MPLVTYTQEPIRVPISDAVIGGTTMKRKALLTRMTQTLPNDAPQFAFVGQDGTTVTLNLTIEHYAVGPVDAAGNATYGERLSTKFPGINYQIEVIASSRSLVDAATGQYLCDTTEYNNALRLAEQSGEPVVLPSALLNADGTEKSFMKEDEFFRKVADTKPIVVTDLEKQYIAAATANL